MPEITLKEGDFGADVTANVGSETLYLPDRDRPGLTMAVPIAEVVEMDSLNDDGWRPVKEALKLGAMGLLTGPKGLAEGFHSVTKVKDVVFSALLRDGRRFVAVTDAKTYAELHAAQVAARTAQMRGGADEDAPHPADDIIAKYLDQARAQETMPAEPEPRQAQPEPAPAVERRRGERREVPSFGRRRPS